MRYIKRPEKPNIQPSYPNLVTALFNTVEDYCSFCEKKLNYSAYLFDKVRGNLDRDAVISLDNWENLLLICGECRESVTNFNPQDRYLWPDSQDNLPSPLSYVKKDNVTYQVLDSNGEIFKTEQLSFILVEVSPNISDSSIKQAANKTIALFQLNSKYYNNDPQNPQITLPYQDFIDVTDVRLEQRYKAYQIAIKNAERLKRAATTLAISEGREFVDNSLILINQTLESMGYVSTWETAIRQSLDRETLQKIFAPNKRKRPNEPIQKSEVIDELLLEENERPTKKRRLKRWSDPPIVPPVQ